MGDEHVTMHQPKKIDIPPKSSQNNPVMKPIYSYALLAAFAAVGQASAVEAVTTPVGYVTETLRSGQFNLIGLTLHQTPSTAGILDAKSSTSVTDNDVNFTTLLTAGATYVLELSNGTIQEITSWSGSVLTTPQNISSFVTTGTTTYVLRKARTISDTFGASNSAGLQSTAEFDPGQADIVFVPNGTGGSDQFFYSSAVGATGWFNAGDFSDGGNIPLVYTDGVTVLRKGANLPLVISGEIKKTSTTYALLGGNFNSLGAIYPVGSTLASSNLSASLTGTDSFDPSLADNIYIPLSAGGYRVFFYSNAVGAEGWFDASDFSDGNPVALTSGISVLRRGVSVNATISAPSGYSTL